MRSDKARGPSKLHKNGRKGDIEKLSKLQNRNAESGNGGDSNASLGANTDRSIPYSPTLT